LRKHRWGFVVFGFVAAGLFALALVFANFDALMPGQNDEIRALQQLPVGATAHLEGVVTYADSIEKRYWVQDNTGAISFDQDPHAVGVRAGQTVRVVATKASSYNPLAGPKSVGLKDAHIAVTKPSLPLPAPVIATLRTLPDKEKSGMRVQLTGVVRRVIRDNWGRLQLEFGESGLGIPATVYEAKSDPSRWVDARVRVTGIVEVSYNDAGVLLGRRIWVQSSDDIQMEESAPKEPRLQTIRALYRDPEARAGHRVRVRGTLAKYLSSNSFLLEDSWGAIVCQLDRSTEIAAGTPVEVAGFPNVDRIRIELNASTVMPISLRQAGSDSEVRSRLDLTTVAAIRSLPVGEASSGLPVRVTGVITYNDPDWRHLFLQDATGGIFVKYSGSRIPLGQGRRVTVMGMTHAGDYAPIIVAPKFLDAGKAPLPRAIPATPRDAASGILDSQLVEVEGVIHPIKRAEEVRHLTFELYSSFGQIHVYTGPTFANARYIKDLEDTTVRIRGVLGTVFNARRQMIGHSLSVSTSKDVEILHPAAAAPFTQAAMPVNTLLRFSPRADFSHRIKVMGSVTMIGSGFFYLQDSTGGLEVRGDPRAVRLADLVEVVGYATAGAGYSPVLTDAAVRVVEPKAPIEARSVTPESVLEGQFDSQVVTMDGRLLSVVDTNHGRNLVVQSGAVTFNAQLDSAESGPPVRELAEGSTIRLTGVCSVQVDPGKLYLLLSQEPVGFKLLLRSPADIQVITPPSWWTGRHALTVFGILSLTILIGIAWVTRLRWRVQEQMSALQKAAEEAAAIRDLARGMQDVTIREDFGARVSVRGSDGITQLGVEFNRMLAELEQRDRAKKEAEARLQRQALTDELTGLPNRRLLSDRLAHTLPTAKREAHIVALLYVDLDGFKLVNDSLGHTVGDSLLGQVAERLQSRIRESDTLARLGGDEFTVILTGLHSKDQAELVARHLLDVLTAPFCIEEHDITIGASIGISFFPDDGTDEVTLLQQADSAMYAAKRNGKNQFMLFTPELGSIARERLSLENQLRGAISRGEISLDYQPEFELSTHRLVRFEALARWTHPTLGTIPPAKFIPIAEESGLILPMGAYLMELACTEAAQWQTSSGDPVQVAVNVSSLQFARDSFVDEVAEVLHHTGLKPKLLQIELTESVMLTGTERAARTMKQLRALGVSLAIDDFGTGYSCLGYLPKLPFNALKIDRSFVNELEMRPETKAMVHSLVTLAHNLDMQVIVEGVETPQQLEIIRRIGSNEVQGFLLGRPTSDPQSLLSNQPTADLAVLDHHSDYIGGIS